MREKERIHYYVISVISICCRRDNIEDCFCFIAIVFYEYITL